MTQNCIRCPEPPRFAGSATGPSLLLLCANTADEVAIIPAAIEALRASTEKYLVCFPLSTPFSPFRFRRKDLSRARDCASFFLWVLSLRDAACLP